MGLSENRGSEGGEEASSTRVLNSPSNGLEKSVSTGEMKDLLVDQVESNKRSKSEEEERGYSTVSTALIPTLHVEGCDLQPSPGRMKSAPITERGHLSGRSVSDVKSARAMFTSMQEEEVTLEGSSTSLQHAVHLSPPLESQADDHGMSDQREDSIDLLISTVPKHERKKFREFLSGELIPEPVYHTTDVVWGQSERDRVYNALLYVPYQLERLIGFGNAICLNAFLGIYTILPLRVLKSLWILVHVLLGRFGVCAPPNTGRFQGKEGSPTKASKNMTLRGDQIYDLICVSIFAAMVLFLWHIQAGAIYFWVKELTQEFLKLSVLHTALELGDKICCSFGVDVLEALAASCTSLSANPNPMNYIHVASDAIVALLLLLAHAGVLMSQALVYGVAMNSKKNTLLALLIASNFTEIKGTVLKRFDPTKLFVLACQDIVERFHLYIILSFVLVEESIGLGQPLPSSRLAKQCIYVLFAEVVIDVTKHAVLGKFNDIRPGVYGEFTRDLCENLSTSQSHTVHKLVAIEPFASAALFLRIVISFSSLQQEIYLKDDSGSTSVSSQIVMFLLATFLVLFLWVLAAVFNLVLGYGLRVISINFMQRYTGKNKSRIKKRVQIESNRKKHV
jgi:hypothetical protein